VIDISSFKGLTQDSRAVKDGYLFAAFPGAISDGRDFIADAIKRGATAILSSEDAQLPDGVRNVELIVDPNPRKIFAKLAAEFYGRQPEHIVAVTGTNGKTSVVTFVEQLWTAAGFKASSLGTLKGALTTPDPVALHVSLSGLAEADVTHVAIEASSHGLDQYRLDGVNIGAAGFTNLSHDHLDYHENMDAYFDAKVRLFSELVNSEGCAVLNADIPQFERLEKLAVERGLKALSYGRNGKDLKVISLTPTANGQELELGVLGVHKDIILPLVGEFQAMNVLCALGLVVAQNPKNKRIYIDALERIQGAQGRLQLIPEHKKGAVYVDYAHTPDALENVLKALRPHTDGRLVCVFGCGGDRDQTKRPVMGAIASKYADDVIVTDDNPRGEDPAEIRAQILSTAGDAQEIGDRRDAIRRAVQNLNKGDVLVIAGKGHEQGQIFADHTEHFDDAEEAREAIALMNKSIKGD